MRDAQGRFLPNPEKQLLADQVVKLQQKIDNLTAQLKTVTDYLETVKPVLATLTRTRHGVYWRSIEDQHANTPYKRSSEVEVLCCCT
jgi:hypothetical protein